MPSEAKRKVSLPAHVASGKLAGLDALAHGVVDDALAVFCFSDVRPLAGTAGFVDWRLCGALSRAIETGAFSGRAGEVLLLPASGRARRWRIFAFGLGPLAACDGAGLRNVAAAAQRVLRAAGARQVVMAAPAAPGSRVEYDFARLVGEEQNGQVRVLVEELG